MVCAAVVVLLSSGLVCGRVTLMYGVCFVYMALGLIDCCYNILLFPLGPSAIGLRFSDRVRWEQEQGQEQRERCRRTNK